MYEQIIDFLSKNGMNILKVLGLILLALAILFVIKQVRKQFSLREEPLKFRLPSLDEEETLQSERKFKSNGTKVTKDTIIPAELDKPMKVEEISQEAFNAGLTMSSGTYITEEPIMPEITNEATAEELIEETVVESQVLDSDVSTPDNPVIETKYNPEQKDINKEFDEMLMEISLEDNEEK